MPKAGRSLVAAVTMVRVGALFGAVALLLLAGCLGGDRDSPSSGHTAAVEDEALDTIEDIDNATGPGSNQTANVDSDATVEKSRPIDWTGSFGPDVAAGPGTGAGFGWLDDRWFRNWTGVPGSLTAIVNWTPESALYAELHAGFSLWDGEERVWSDGITGPPPIAFEVMFNASALPEGAEPDGLYVSVGMPTERDAWVAAGEQGFEVKGTFAWRLSEGPQA